MLVLPQLSTGSAALYPMTRKSVTRTVVNTLADGRTVILADPDAAAQEWELRATGLTATEWGAIEALFQAVSGRLETFTFLDPAGNLLVRSEEFGAPEWDNGPLITLTAGVDDPVGTTRATRAINSGFVADVVAQTLAVPGDFRYSLSVWARTIGGAAVTLFAATAGGNVERSFALTAQWKRVSVEVGLGQSTESVTFGARLDVGASVDLFGMQAEAQPGVSDYKMTGGSGGVHSKARFAADQLTVRAQGTDVFDAVIAIVSRG